MGREWSGARTKEGFLANFISSLSRNFNWKYIFTIRNYWKSFQLHVCTDDLFLRNKTEVGGIKSPASQRALEEQES